MGAGHQPDNRFHDVAYDDSGKSHPATRNVEHIYAKNIR
jgi:hypothetical protein